MRVFVVGLGIVVSFREGSWADIIMGMSETDS
jgi:hypothetical protein